MFSIPPKKDAKRTNCCQATVALLVLVNVNPQWHEEYDNDFAFFLTPGSISSVVIKKIGQHAFYATSICMFVCLCVFFSV